MAEEGLQGLGVVVVAVRVASIRADAEVEKALQTPTREDLHQQADLDELKQAANQEPGEKK